MGAMEKHRNDADTRNARQKSGFWRPADERRGRSGLCDEELTVRDQRDYAKRDIVVAKALRRETSDRRSWERYGSYSQGPAPKECEHLQWWTHRKWPRSFDELKGWEQNLLTRLENGELEEQHQDAVERHGGPVCAKRFRVG